MLTPTIPASDPNHPPPFTPDRYPPTILFRIYGPSTDALISREEELRILHVLSTKYGLGPRVYGTFTNGRIEQFFPSRAITPSEMRDPQISEGIARRMRELHSVSLDHLGYDNVEPSVWQSLSEWIEIAQERATFLGSIGEKWAHWVGQYNIPKLREEIERYRNFVENDPGKGRQTVFSRK